MFFDDHPEFLETSETAATLDRLNLRHRAIIEQNQSVLRGARVVDIASHDGRWSFAALDAGAAHVTGIEGREELVRNARRTFRAKGVPEEQFRFLKGDVHRRLLKPDIEADVVLCLGFLYHTARYVELFKGIQSTGAQYVVVDTRVLPDVTGPLVQLHTEGTRMQALAVRDRFTMGGRVLSATPSEDAVVLMLETAGYEVDQRVDWDDMLAGFPDAVNVPQYADGRRVTFRARRRAERARPRKEWTAAGAAPSPV